MAVRVYVYVCWLIFQGSFAFIQGHVSETPVSCDSDGEYMSASLNLSYQSSCQLTENGTILVSIRCTFPSLHELKSVFRNSVDLLQHKDVNCSTNEVSGTTNLVQVSCLLSAEMVRGATFSCLLGEGLFSVDIHHYCPHPIAPDNARLLTDPGVSSRFPVGSNFLYQCYKGFLPEGNLILNCSIPLEQPDGPAMWETLHKCVLDNSGLTQYLFGLLGIPVLIIIVVFGIVICCVAMKYKTNHKADDEKESGSGVIKDDESNQSEGGEQEVEEKQGTDSFKGTSNFPDSLPIQSNSTGSEVITCTSGNRPEFRTSSPRGQMSRCFDHGHDETSNTTETWKNIREQHQSVCETLKLDTTDAPNIHSLSIKQDSVNDSIAPPTKPTVELVYSKLKHIAPRSVSCLAKELNLDEGDPKENLMELIGQVFKIFHSRTATAKITEALKAIGENELAGELKEMFSSHAVSCVMETELSSTTL